MTQRQIDMVMNSHEYAQAVKDLARFERQPLPGSRVDNTPLLHNTIASTAETTPSPLPGGIVLQERASSSLLPVDAPNWTTGCVTFPATFTLSPSWTQWMTGSHKRQISAKTKLSLSAFKALDSAFGMGSVSVDDTDGLCNTINGFLDDTEPARFLFEADKIAGYMVFGWDYDKNELVKCDLAGYVNPLLEHRRLLEQPAYAACFASFAYVQVTPTLVLKPAIINENGGFPETFPFALTLRFRLTDFAKVEHIFDYRSDVGYKSNKVMDHLIKPYLPVMGVFRTALPDLRSFSTFSRLADIGRLASLLLWHRQSPSQQAPGISTRFTGKFKPFLNQPHLALTVAPPAAFATTSARGSSAIGKPLGVLEAELFALETTASSKDGTLGALLNLKAAGLNAQLGRHDKAAAFSVHALLESTRAGLDGVFGTFLGALCQFVTAICTMTESTYNTTLVSQSVSIFWLALAHHDKLDKDDGVPQDLINARQHVTALSAFNQCLRFSYARDDIKIDPRYDDLALASGALARLLGGGGLSMSFPVGDTDLEAKADQLVGKLEFNQAVVVLHECYMSHAPHKRIFEKLEIAFSALNGQQALADARYLIGSDDSKSLAQARIKLREAVSFFPRTAAWLSYTAAVNMSRHQGEQAWADLAETERLTAFVPESTVQYVVDFYNKQFATAIVAVDTVNPLFADGWAI
ncbi:hypothetical protein ACM66B_006352 [Microbotryomycetes sp. NB124-2]